VIFSKGYTAIYELQGKPVLQQTCSSASMVICLFPSELKKLAVQLTGTSEKAELQNCCLLPPPSSFNNNFIKQHRNKNFEVQGKINHNIT